jgi:protein SCO1/2
MTSSQSLTKDDQTASTLLPAAKQRDTAMCVETRATHLKKVGVSSGYKRSTHQYALPDTTLTDQNGNKTTLQQLLSTDRPVILNFIFTSCTTVCPILSATLAQANKAFADDKIQPLLISISIDPQYDSPMRLHDYAERYHANGNWYFLTGERQQIISLQRAFDAYYGTKMNHQPVNFLRRSPHDAWVRLQGFTSAASLVAEYRALFAPPG